MGRSGTGSSGLHGPGAADRQPDSTPSAWPSEACRHSWPTRAVERSRARGPSSGKTFGDACAEHERYSRDDKQLAASTLNDYRNAVNGRLLPEFGADTPLEKITTERIDDYREKLLAESGLSRRTIQKLLVILHGIMKRAKRRGWIASNPAEDVERVQVRRSGDFNVLSPSEVAAITSRRELDAPGRALHDRRVLRPAARGAARAPLGATSTSPTAPCSFGGTFRPAGRGRRCARSRRRSDPSR